MRSCALLFMLWMVTTAVKGQSLHPGGVKGAIQWYCTDTMPSSLGLRSHLTGNNEWLRVDDATISTLNFHPSLVLTGLSPLRVDLGERDLRSASYFTVYQALDTTNEKMVWYMTSNEQTTLVLTTDRMADLSVNQYMNYRDVVRTQPKVNSYVQHKEKDTTGAITKQWWNIGVKPTSPQLPVMDFKGLVPEIIAYDRVLNSQERLQVASYLALKYGITLTEPGATYLNSTGDKIWDGYDYSAWHRNIAGIGRDDTAGLHQTIATSSNTPGLLTIAARDPLSNNSFLLWGDNGKTLTTAAPVAGLPRLLQRTWLVKTYGNTQPFATDVVIDTRAIDAALSAKPVYWLVIDPTGEGEFTAPAVEFIKMDHLDKQGIASFKNVVWDKDGSGKDVWSIIAAQELLLATVINQPACTAPGTGSLQVRILGGKGPFQLSVKSAGRPLINRRIDESTSPIDFEDLGTGKYFLQVTDAAQHIYKDSFYINSNEAPVPVAIAANYTIPPVSALKLDAAEAMPDGLLWEWSGPESFQSFNAQVAITTPGLYTLRCSKDGCSHSQDVAVTATPANALYDVTVYPNPSPNAFSARVTLDKPAPVTMTLYGPDGRLIATQKGTERAHYLFTGDLKIAGVYELVFISGLSKTSKRLIIAK